MFFLSLFVGTAYGQKIESVLNEDQKGLLASQSAQVKIETLDDQKQALITKSRQVSREQKLADKYNALLRSQVAGLELALESIEEKQANLRKTRMKLTPLMESMLDVFTKLVDSDVPFLMAERTARVANLRDKLSDSRLSEGAKMSLLLDAYQVELSYGYTIESWQGYQDKRLVNFLRVGRLGYYSLSLDGKEAKIWDQQWKPLPPYWLPHLQQASEVASGEVLPKILSLPPFTTENI